MTRLHIGYLIYISFSVLSSNIPRFEEWYMYVFLPLIDWEDEMQGKRYLAEADFTDGQDTENEYAYTRGHMKTRSALVPNT